MTCATEAVAAARTTCTYGLRTHKGNSGASGLPATSANGGVAARWRSTKLKSLPSIAPPPRSSALVQLAQLHAARSAASVEPVRTAIHSRQFNAARRTGSGAVASASSSMRASAPRTRRLEELTMLPAEVIDVWRAECRLPMFAATRTGSTAQWVDKSSLGQRSNGVTVPEPWVADPLLSARATASRSGPIVAGPTLVERTASSKPAARSAVGDGGGAGKAFPPSSRPPPVWVAAVVAAEAAAAAQGGGSGRHGSLSVSALGGLCSSSFWHASRSCRWHSMALCRWRMRRSVSTSAADHTSSAEVACASTASGVRAAVLSSGGNVSASARGSSKLRQHAHCSDVRSAGRPVAPRGPRALAEKPRSPGGVATLARGSSFGTPAGASLSRSKVAS